MGGSESLWTDMVLGHGFLNFRDEILNIQGVSFALISLSLLAMLFQRIKDARNVARGEQTVGGLPELLQKRIAVVSFFLVAATSFCCFIYAWGWTRLILALGFSLATALSFFRPSFSICFFLAILLLRPWEVMEANILMLAMPKAWAGISMFSWSANQLLKGRFFFFWDRLCTMILLFSVWVLLSTLKTPNVSFAVSDFIDTFFKSASLFFFAINLIEDELDLFAFRATLVIGIIGLGFIGVYRTFFDPELQSVLEHTSATRLQSYGLLGDPNYLSAILLIALPIVVRPVFSRHAHGFYRIAGLGCVAIVALVIYLSKSRGAILSLLILGAFFLIMQIRSKVVATTMAAGLISALVPLTAFLGRAGNDLADSSQSRLNYWTAAWKMAIHNPLLGVGFNRYKFAYDSFAPANSVEWGERTAHSSWFLVLAETGFPGLFLYLLVFSFVFRQAWSLRQSSPELIYSLVGYTVAMSFLSHAFLIYPYILFAFIAATYRIKSNLIEPQT